MRKQKNTCYKYYENEIRKCAIYVTLISLSKVNQQIASPHQPWVPVSPGVEPVSKRYSLSRNTFISFLQLWYRIFLIFFIIFIYFCTFHTTVLNQIQVIYVKSYIPYITYSIFIAFLDFQFISINLGYDKFTIQKLFNHIPIL